MEADAIIRQRSDGARSLDDFCRRFLGRNSSPDDTVPYELPEIITHLKATANFDWERFLSERTSRPLDALPLELVGRLGYRLQYVPAPPDQDRGMGRGRTGISAQHSLGLSFGNEGQILDIVPGMPGDKAGLAPGMKVMGIGGRLFSARRLQDALGESVATRRIELLVLEGDQFKTIVIPYADGPRYLTMVRDESKPDLLGQILKPIAEQEKPMHSPQSARRPERGASLPRGYVAYRAEKPLRIDGKLDEPAWQAAPWTDAFVDIEGDRKPHPRYPTQAKMLWDDQYLYVAARLDEPHVWGTLTKHDSVIFHDNDFEVFIDPDGDHHEYYEIEINALGTEWDLFLKKPYRDGGPAVDAWEIPGLRSAVHVEGTLNNPGDTDSFWAVELAFPWKVLAEYAHRPAPPRDGEQWRINFSRVEWRHEVKDGKYRKVPDTPENNWVWSPQGVIDMHRPERWGVVQFSTAAPGSITYRPDPALPTRERLIEIYHAQKRFHDKNGRWAERSDQLDIAAAPGEKPAIKAMPGGYEAALTFTPEGGAQQTWTIREDSRITRRP